MAELAVDIDTGLIHSVTEIANRPQLHLVRWRCLSCDIEVFPAAHLPRENGQGHVVSAYFRSSLPHGGCLQDGLGAQGGARGPQRQVLDPDVPIRLVLRGAQGAAELRVEEVQEEAQEDVERGEGEERRLPARPQLVLGSLHPLALAHLGTNLLGRNRMQILDWPESEFQYTFKQLRGRQVLSEIRSNRIFYSDIRFVRERLSAEGVEITLAARSSDPNPQNLTVKFLTQHLADRAKVALERTIRHWLERRQTLHRAGNGEVRLYFIATRSNSESATFLVEDPRLFTFVEI
ncbi:hypothetical protein ELG88_08375 [Rhizobium leguminosarum]|uniref:hypothetical protein n=1 Tax=Rhizobium leguminosarum TaxID=384 RepID=UPI00103179B0|nr:hypothetical protein [Rhizobium leguminosarum]TBF35229.1 hypothetical protein ELG88_08375 [Rhizobium leguminosarum]